MEVSLPQEAGSFADDLARDGLIVFRLFSDKETEALSLRFDDELRANPLIADTACARIQYAAKPAMAAFGALGDPWTMHMPVQREVNAAYDAWIRANLKGFGGKKFVMIHRDRAMVRVPGTSIQGETCHRDQPAAHIEPRGDITLGGWLSLSGNNRFVCVPKTHSSKSQGRNGFVKIPPDESKRMMSLMHEYNVPPGFAIAFFQNIIHCIKPGKVRVRTTRIFQGASFTDCPDAWFPEQDVIIKEFRVQPLPSGQTPYMYEKFHAANWGDRVVEYSKNFVAEVARNPRKFIPQVMPSLTQLVARERLPPPYTAEQSRILFPHPF